MRRANLKVKGYGSGVAEAVNEAPVNQRMKRAGHALEREAGTSSPSGRPVSTLHGGQWPERAPSTESRR